MGAQLAEPYWLPLALPVVRVLFTLTLPTSVALEPCRYNYASSGDERAQNEREGVGKGYPYGEAHERGDVISDVQVHRLTRWSC